jgi:predicted nucleic acid-binding protein
MTAHRLTVIDASIAVKWVLAESGEEPAIEILKAYGAKEMDLIAPALLMEEVASAISKRCRRKELTAAQARSAYLNFEARRPELVDKTVYVSRAFELSLVHQISVWDAVYLAVAIDRRADLLTADRRLYRTVSRHYPFALLLAG